jgi:hypothetical protein
MCIEVNNNIVMSEYVKNEICPSVKSEICSSTDCEHGLNTECEKQRIIASYLDRDIEFGFTLDQVKTYVCMKLYPVGNDLIKNHIISHIQKGIRIDISQTNFISEDSEEDYEANISNEELLKGNGDNNCDVKTYKYEQLVDYTPIYEKAKINQRYRETINACENTPEIYKTLDISDLTYLGL